MEYFGVNFFACAGDRTQSFVHAKHTLSPPAPRSSGGSDVYPETEFSPSLRDSWLCILPSALAHLLRDSLCILSSPMPLLGSDYSHCMIL